MLFHIMDTLTKMLNVSTIVNLLSGRNRVVLNELLAINIKLTIFCQYGIKGNGKKSFLSGSGDDWFKNLMLNRLS